MNKSVDERLVPQGEYVDALNVRLGSTENSEIGSVENAKGNELLVTPLYLGSTLAFKTLGVFSDSSNETLYWFIHADAAGGATNKVDMILSHNVISKTTTYHVVSVDDGGGVNTTLNFNDTYLINGINKIDNLLFFTDNLNPPRFIDVNKDYPEPIGNIDQFTAEDILVIKKPPLEAPFLRLINIADDDTYLEERFICFAYRYKYSNNEYSATSQFTSPAFSPKPFNLSLESSINEGMVNEFNAVQVTYNTGSSLVTEIQILFKEADNNVVKVIESFNKSDLGLSNNNLETILFDNSKIFTILADSEILRLYDNVPLLSKAQTTMGNRLMYANYFEGYDLKNSSGQDIVFNYNTSLVSTDINEYELVTTLTDSTISMDCTSGSIVNVTVPDGQVGVFLTDDGLSTGNDLVLKAGGQLTFDIQFIHQSYGGDTSGAFTAPTSTTPATNLTIDFNLGRDYTSAFDLATSTEFVQYIGSPTNVKTVANCLTGISRTDSFNCSVPNSQTGASGGGSTTLSKCYSGTSDLFCTGNTPVFDTAFAVLGIRTDSADPSFIGLTLMAMAYTDTCPINGEVAATQVVFEYYKINLVSAAFKDIGSPLSLHSNRNYETAIVYMDEFNRSSTPIVSPQNTITVACGQSGNQNKIKATIPTTMKPPVWASRYKFVVQPDRDTYNTVFVNLFFVDPNSTRVWCLLEGENAQKVEKGDRLIVKRDSFGIKDNCVYTTVLEKEVQIKNFITIPELTLPSGSYMAVSPLNWAVNSDESAIFNPGTTALKDGCDTEENPSRGGSQGSEESDVPRGHYFFSEADSAGVYTDVDVPAGSVINWYMEFKRRGPADGNNKCERVIYTLDLKGLVARENYANVYDWFIGDGIESLLNTGIWDVGDSGSDGTLTFITALNTSGSTICDTVLATHNTFGTQTPKDYYMGFAKNTTSTQDALLCVVEGGRNCGRNERRQSSVTMGVQIIKSESSLVFESEPLDSSPGLFYEGQDNYPITGGFHMSGTNIGDQNQTASQDAIINLNFGNCFSFGNGVESYKIRDSIVGKSMNLGNRVYGATEQIYQRTHRNSDITYSGIYNDESNINKLNEFNLGLVNFKQLEESFGPIELLSGRRNDILCLQEDKISYVLSGKNLLSDASGGSSLTSVPEVLGTQITRAEDYGISNNPESYCEWGADKFFTDVKRGAIIQLKGSAAQNEQMSIISEFGMRGHFRDLFIESSLTQKIGGFDPYMNEYVLSVNNTLLPQDSLVYSCGISNEILLEAGTEKTYVYNLTAISGNARFNYESTLSDGLGTTEFVANWIDDEGNAASVSSGAVTTDGFITVLRDVPSITKVTITVNLTAGIAGWIIRQDCPIELPLTVVQVCITNGDENLDSNFNEFYWNTFSDDPQPSAPYYTNPSFSSPITSTFVDFLEGSGNVVSQYAATTGLVGEGGFPPKNGYVTIQSLQRAPANFVFNLVQDNFKYLESNTLYQNTPSDISTLLASATNINKEEVVAGVQYRGQFARANNRTYLYLIWDFRSLQASLLKYQVGTGNLANDRFAACCTNAASAYFLDGATLSSANVVYDDINRTTVSADGYYSDGNFVRLQKTSFLQPDITDCACGINCASVYVDYPASNVNIYKSRWDVSSATGAVLIAFAPGNVPVGIRVTYDGVVYNKWTSAAFGDVSPNSNSTPVYLGVTGQGTLPANGNYNIQELSSVTSTGSFTATGNYVTVPNQTENVIVGSGQIKTDVSSQGICTLIVPKPAASINYLDVKIYNLLPDTNVAPLYKNVAVACPANLTSVDADTTQTYSSETLACGGQTDNGGQIFGIPTQTPGGGTVTSWSVGTRVYANVNGTSPAVNTDASSPGYSDRIFGSAGWVKTGANDPGTGGEQAIELDSESVIITTFGCAP
tara:strand:- start:2180 stop:7849 length:5670 start_codon:yes stop_codon:yes gene_type:complete